MVHKVIKRLYDPFLKRWVFPGEMLEITNERMDTYRPYIIETLKPVEEPIKVEKPIEVTESVEVKEPVVEKPKKPPVKRKKK